MNWKPDWVDVSKYLSLEDLEGEEWKHLTMWKGKALKDYYFISNLGRLKSLCPLHQPKILPGTNDLTTGGYIHTFVRTEDNHQISFDYHQAVCYYFVGPPPSFNRQRCFIAEFPDQLFNSIAEASRFISRGDWYISECIKQNRPIKHGLTKEILHVTYLEESN